MKIIRIIVSAFIVLLSCLSIYTSVHAYLDKKDNYIAFVEKGDELAEKGLYQMACAEYEKAMMLEENLEVRIKYTDAYANAYKDGVVTKKELFSVLDRSTALYSEYMPFWQEYLQACIDNNDYTTGYLVAQKSIRLNIQSDDINLLRDQILYSYKKTSTTYSNFSSNSNGEYTVCNRENWGTLKNNGDKKTDYIYSYVSPLNSNGEAVYISEEKGSRVISSDGVVEFILEDTVKNCRAYGDLMLPIKRDDGKWEYLCVDDNSESITDVFDDASSFTNGNAAVKIQNQWHLIHTDGTVVSDSVFDDIKLYSNGEFIRYDCFVAGVDGKYGVYDQTGTLMVDFTSRDMDVYMGDLIAYQADNGDWGYVNKDGEVVIEAKYNRAKSFSGGLGAVYNGKSWGFINSTGRLVIDYTFLNVDYFTAKGFCMVQETPEEFHGIKLRY